MSIEELTALLEIKIDSIIIGWIIFVFGLITKDILTSFVYGIMFYLDPQFVEGDVVYIDGEKAIIQKIGLTVSIFKNIENSRWLYIKNEKIRYHKLEKQMEKS